MRRDYLERAAPAADLLGVDLLYDLLEAFVRFMNAGPPFPLDVLYLVVAAVPVVLVHELGHAIAARRLLGAPVTVSVGGAGKLAELRLGEVAITVKALSHPGRAAGVAEFDASRATARDVLLIALAGPAASLLGTVLTAWAFSVTAGSGAPNHLFMAATLAGAFGVLNLVPISFQERRGGATVRTDGGLALDALRVARALS
jgi:hypothetical protein